MMMKLRGFFFQWGVLKAPRFDGFPAIFYKSNWFKVGPSLCQFVRNVFLGGVSVANANRTLISLIPKIDHVELVSHFRPMALCLVHYKCIAKLIAIGLRKVMTNLISPFQASFIKGLCCLR